MDRHDWDVRYRGDDLVWASTPNEFLVSETGELRPGRVLDLACGQGRNAVWLAEHDWQVTGVDFSPVGLEKGRRLAESRDVEIEWIESDVAAWKPPPEGFDLVVVLYLQLPQPQRSAALGLAASAVAVGGTLLVVAHDLDNLTRGFGGARRAEVLYRVGDVTDAADAAGLAVQRAEQVVRVIDTEDGPKEAIDTLVRARRPIRRWSAGPVDHSGSGPENSR